MSMLDDILNRPTHDTVEAKKQASTVSEVARVYNPNTGLYRVYEIQHVILAPDTFCYGNITENGQIIPVYFSPFKHEWSI